MCWESESVSSCRFFLADAFASKTWIRIGWEMDQKWTRNGWLMIIWLYFLPLYSTHSHLSLNSAHLLTPHQPVTSSEFHTPGRCMVRLPPLLAAQDPLTKREKCVFWLWSSSMKGQRQTKWRGFQITYTRLEPLPHRFAASDFDWWRRVLSRTFTYLPGFWQNGAIQDSAGARATWCRGRYYFPDRSSLLSLLSLYSFHLFSIIEFQRLICSARLI